MANDKTTFQTEHAPQAIGAYSQAASAGGLVFISGQIPLHPQSGEMEGGGDEAQIRRVFENFRAVCEAAGGCCDDCVKLTVYLCDLSMFAKVNEVMEEFFSRPFPARAAVEVSALPKGARVEVEGIMRARS